MDDGISKYAEQQYDTVLALDAGIYPLECIMISTYHFMDDAYFYVYGEEPDGRVKTYNVGIKPRSEADSRELAGNFLNALVRCCLRARAGKRSSGIRQHVIGRVLSSFSPAGEPGGQDDANPETDTETGAGSGSAETHIDKNEKN